MHYEGNEHLKTHRSFLKVIDSCSGQVELVTADGDRLNLKSKLCQLVSLSTIFESASTIPEMEIIAHEAEDSRKYYGLPDSADKTLEQYQ